MAFTTPRTWVTGELVTASLMNTHVRDNLRYLKGLDGAITFEDAIRVSNDASTGLELTGGESYWLGDTGDNLRYNRAGDTWLFYIGGNEVARVDGGHIKALGSLKAGNDDVCALRLAAGETILDGDTGDNMRYNRAGNLWLWYIGGAEYLRLGATGLSITGAVDASTYVEAGTNPAASGVVRLPNNDVITARNQANNADVALLKLSTSDEAEIGATTRVTGAVDASTYLEAGTSPAQSGAVRIPNNDAIIARNQANDGDVAVIKLTTGDEVDLRGGAVTISATQHKFPVNRQGAAGTNWSTAGTTNEAETGAFWQCGSINIDFGAGAEVASVTVTLPVALTSTQSAVGFAISQTDAEMICHCSIAGTTQLVITGRHRNTSGSISGTKPVYWLVIGQ